MHNRPARTQAERILSLRRADARSKLPSWPGRFGSPRAPVSAVMLRLSLLGAPVLTAGCSDTDKPGDDSRDDDPGDSSGPQGGSPSETGNTAPTAPEVTIEPTAPTAADGLTAVLVREASDTDGDALTTTYTWSVDGSETADHTGPTVPAEATAKGQVWEVTVVADDGVDRSDPAVASTTIRNAPPAVGSATAGPDGATARDTLSCAVNDVTDVDGDPVALLVAWFVDGVEVAAGDTLAPGPHGSGSEVFCRVTPSDGEDDGDPVDSTVLAIENALPVIVDVSLAPVAPTTDDRLTVTVTVDEPDSDTLTYTHSWFVNGSPVGVVGDTLDGATHFDKHDVVAVEVTVDDGRGGADTVRSTDVLVGNTAPAGTAVSLSPAAPRTGEDIVATATGADADGDTLTWTFEWIVDGATVSGETSDTLPSAYTSAGASVVVVATPSDGETDGTPVTSATLAVVNTPPTVDAVSLGPTEAYTDDTLTVSVSGSDADGDSLSYRYAWSVDGVAISATASTLDGATWFSKGDVVAVEVTANDGTDDSLATVSTSTTILNSAPVGSSVSLSSMAPTTTDTLTATPTGSDADGDTISWTHAWYVNGGVVSGETGSSLTGGHFSSGDSVYVVATPHDGVESGTSVTSATATVANTAPVATGVTLSPSAVATDGLLTATPTGSDADGDSLSWTYAWYVDGARVSSVAGATLDGSSFFDRDEVVYVVATPSDGTDTGTAVTSSSVTVGNTAPTDAAIAIAPTNALDDDDLVCEVTTASTDADADTISYTIAWDVDGATFTGATTTTHTGDTVDAADTGPDEVWTCTVTPTDGTDTAATVDASVSIRSWPGEREFTTCGATGRTGPSQSDCNTEYSGTTLASEVIVSGGVQEWEVPFDGDFVITAYGAQGASGDASYVGGWGAKMEGTFSLTAGDVLSIVVGQMGEGQSSNTSGAGGGGTFVVDASGDPLLVAGGGGGTRTSVSRDGCDALHHEYGTIGSGSAMTGPCTVKTTEHGLGGVISASGWGSGGGGFYGDGESEGYWYPTWGGDGGASWANGMLGGAGNAYCGTPAEGGFGGGGSGNGCHGGGGGGGYSGGDGGRVAGAGGSYVDSAATSTSAAVGANEGDGWVVIDFVE